MKKIQWAWHIHHDILIEPLIEPLKNRIEYIKKNKPIEEQPLRLRLLKEVKGKLPGIRISIIEKAYTEWRKADTEWRKADAKWEKAGAKWRKADAKWNKKYRLQILALHAKECPDCTWNEKKQSIF